MEMEMPTPPMENSQPTPTHDDGAQHSSEDGVSLPQNHQPYFSPQFSPSHSHSPDANGGGESDQKKLSAEEVKGVLEIIASTGKFWHDWDELKSMLLFQLKQVLSEYPEARKPDEQNSALGESYLQLWRNLEDALFNFIEGPPFTLQRLCEILLDAQTIYPNLSKLALALEKNLLVTSTLTKCTDSYPPSTAELADASTEFIEDADPLPQAQPHPEPELHPQHQPQPEPEHQPHVQHQPQLEPEHQPHVQHQPQLEPEHQPHVQHQSQLEPEHQPHVQHQPQLEPEHQPHAQHQPQPEPEHQPHVQQQPQPEPESQSQLESSPSPHSNAVENGGEPMTEDRDEVMSEVDAEVDDGMTIDMETFEEIISSSESTNPQSNNSQS